MAGKVRVRMSYELLEERVAADTDGGDSVYTYSTEAGKDHARQSCTYEIDIATIDGGAGATVGFNGGGPHYLEASDSAWVQVSSGATSEKFIMIKAEKNLFLTTTALSKNLFAGSVSVAAGAGGTPLVARLKPGQFVILPITNATDADLTAATYYIKSLSATGNTDTGIGHCAVSFIALD